MIRIHDTANNEIIDREMTDDEYAAFIADQQVLAAKKAQAEAAKAAAENKLAALGLTADDLKALGL